MCAAELAASAPVPLAPSEPAEPQGRNSGHDLGTPDDVLGTGGPHVCWFMDVKFELAFDEMRGSSLSGAMHVMQVLDGVSFASVKY